MVFAVTGVLGVRSRTSPLVIPRVPDCIALLLGSEERYLEAFNKEPGTYYLSKGWIEDGDDPLKVYDRYLAKYGEETTRWVTKEMMKHYTRIALIDTGAFQKDDYVAYARRVADFIGVRYEEMAGSLALLQRLFSQRWGKEFVLLPPGEGLTAELFEGVRQISQERK